MIEGLRSGCMVNGDDKRPRFPQYPDHDGRARAQDRPRTEGGASRGAGSGFLSHLRQCAKLIPLWMMIPTVTSIYRWPCSPSSRRTCGCSPNALKRTRGPKGCAVLAIGDQGLIDDFVKRFKADEARRWPKPK